MDLHSTIIKVPTYWSVELRDSFHLLPASGLGQSNLQITRTRPEVVDDGYNPGAAKNEMYLPQEQCDLE